MSGAFDRRRPRLDPIYAQVILATVTCAGLGLIAVTAGAQSPPVSSVAPLVQRTTPPASLGDVLTAGTGTPPAPNVAQHAPEIVNASTGSAAAAQAAPPASAQHEAFVPPIRRVRPAAAIASGKGRAAKPAVAAKAHKPSAAPTARAPKPSSKLAVAKK